MKKKMFVATIVACQLFTVNVFTWAQSSTVNLPDTLPQVTPPGIIITEIYGGGGNSGATYNLDFIELYNTTKENISLSNWSLQYYTASGTTPSKSIVFPQSAQVQAESYFLVAVSGGANGENLPGYDLQEAVVLSSTSAKIVLYNSKEPQGITDISSLLNNPVLVDYVPYGKSALPVWGTAMAKDCSATLSASRNKLQNGQFSYTKDIGFDFTATTPLPQYSGLLNSIPEYCENKVYCISSNGFTLETKEDTFIRLYDLQGKMLISKWIKAGNEKISVEKSGLYILKMANQSLKLMIQP